MQVQKDEIRNAILEAALREFYQNGYEKATMSAISEQCKISKSNLYRYFPSKEEIYLTLMKPAMMELRRTTAYLTSDVFVGKDSEVIAKIMADSIFQLVHQYKKEMAVIMTTKLEGEKHSFQEEMIEYLVKCFFTMDTSKMPNHFTYILASMIMDGVNRIIMENEDEDEIYHQLLALFRYHTKGVCAFL